MGATIWGCECVDTFVVFDGSKYVDCTFQGCRLAFSGKRGTSLHNIEFDKKCRWQFSGPAANTVLFMQELYNNGGAGGRELIENIFESIRQNTAPPIVHQ